LQYHHQHRAGLVLTAVWWNSIGVSDDLAIGRSFRDAQAR